MTGRYLTGYHTPEAADTHAEACAYWDACDDAAHDRAEQRRDAEADEAWMARFPAPREDGPLARAFVASVAEVARIRGAAR